MFSLFVAHEGIDLVRLLSGYNSCRCVQISNGWAELYLGRAFAGFTRKKRYWRDF